MSVARRSLLGLVFGTSFAHAAFAPWEPAFTVHGNTVQIRPPAAVRTTRDRVEILLTESCNASATSRTVRWNGDCAFLSATYVATVEGKNGEPLRVSFPFSVSARGTGHTLLLDLAEVLDQEPVRP